MHRFLGCGAIATILLAWTIVASAQIGGKPVRGGNPTPGTPQPDPPNLADRITLTGCLQPAQKDAPTGAVDGNTPTNTRFVLSNAERLDKNPPSVGGSPLAAKAVARTFRLEGIESQFSPVVNTKVEISGEVRPSSQGAGTESPTLLVEFVQKLASTCR